MRAAWRRSEKARFDVGEMPDWKALRLKVTEKPPRELSADEETALFDELREGLLDVVDFALKAGWRHQEVIALHGRTSIRRPCRRRRGSREVMLCAAR